MPRGGFGRGFGGRGFGGRRFGMPLVYPLGGWGMGSPLLTTLMAGGLGYMVGSNSAQQPAPPQQAAPPCPYQGLPAAPGPASSTESGTLAQLKLLGELHDAGYLTDDEFEREKQRILRG
jgi:hypothetical protein